MCQSASQVPCSVLVTCICKNEPVARSAGCLSAIWALDTERVEEIDCLPSDRFEDCRFALHRSSMCNNHADPTATHAARARLAPRAHLPPVCVKAVCMAASIGHPQQSQTDSRLPAQVPLPPSHNNNTRRTHTQDAPPPRSPGARDRSAPSTKEGATGPRPHPRGSNQSPGSNPVWSSLL